jgi:RimJ/RimL family protein N-acetyltransferase
LVPAANSSHADSLLKTERLHLRRVQSEDAPRIFACIQSPQFPELLPLKEMDSNAKIKKWLKNLLKYQSQKWAYSWIVELKNTCAMLGQVTLTRKEDKKTWALAFWTRPECWGKGYATEAVHRVVQFAFEELAAAKIWASAGQWNRASCRVLEKLGMVYCRDNDNGYKIRGEPVATREYELTFGDWQVRNQ